MAGASPALILRSVILKFGGAAGLRDSVRSGSQADPLLLFLEVSMSFLSSFLGTVPGAVSQALIWAVMALGVHITYRVMNISDLTVDGSIATGGAVAVTLIRSGSNPVVAVVAASLSGAVAGLVTALLHTKARIPAILSGILTQLALYSVNLRIMAGRANQTVSVDRFPLVVSQRFVRVLSLRNPLFLLSLLVPAIIAALYCFYGTERGCGFRATGSNPAMARSQGINTESNIILALMLSNALVAASGALLAQYQGSADVNMGRGAIVIGLAAVVIGEGLLNRVFHNFALRMLAVVIGSIVYYLILQITLQMGLNTNDLKLISAAIVAASLAAPRVFDRGR